MFLLHFYSFTVGVFQKKDTSNVTTVTEVRSTSAHLYSSTWRPWWVLLQHYYVVCTFHRRVWYVFTWSSGIILVP